MGLIGTQLAVHAWHPCDTGNQNSNLSSEKKSGCRLNGKLIASHYVISRTDDRTDDKTDDRTDDRMDDRVTGALWSLVTKVVTGSVTEVVTRNQNSNLFPEGTSVWYWQYQLSTCLQSGWRNDYSWITEKVTRNCFGNQLGLKASYSSDLPLSLIIYLSHHSPVSLSLILFLSLPLFLTCLRRPSSPRLVSSR